MAVEEGIVGFMLCIGVQSETVMRILRSETEGFTRVQSRRFRYPPEVESVHQICSLGHWNGDREGAFRQSEMMHPAGIIVILSADKHDRESSTDRKRAVQQLKPALPCIRNTCRLDLDGDAAETPHQLREFCKANALSPDVERKVQIDNVRVGLNLVQGSRVTCGILPWPAIAKASRISGSWSQNPAMT
ncbi:MAG: hypothetical protein FWD68_10270 [Alphaproteobacteria bacterium]|nr:hypothetical protein [Alphaproteobacteria bacterium]